MATCCIIYDQLPPVTLSVGKLLCTHTLANLLHTLYDQLATPVSNLPHDLWAVVGWSHYGQALMQ